MEEDYIVDDILKPKNKKIKSGQKGKRAELWIVNLFNSRFSELLDKNPDWGKFSRSIGSGNRTTQKVSLSKEAKQVFSSDLTGPPAFKFSVESKSGYNQIDMNSFFNEGNKEVDEFLSQVVRDASRVEKKPMLIWKKDRRPPLAFVNASEFESHVQDFTYRMFYKSWVVINLEKFLSLPEEIFFD